MDTWRISEGLVDATVADLSRIVVGSLIPNEYVVRIDEIVVGSTVLVEDVNTV